MRWHSDYKVVSFYTPRYADYAARLVASLERAGLRHEVEAVSEREWSEATAFKAQFIHDKLRASELPVVWIDADATVETDRLVFPDVDFAIFARFADPHRVEMSPFRTGTVYFGQRKNARQLAYLWVQESKHCPDGIDQWSLFNAWLRCTMTRATMPSSVWLPLPYCQKAGEGQGQPLIRHYMASRQFRLARDNGDGDRTEAGNGRYGEVQSIPAGDERGPPGPDRQPTANHQGPVPTV